MRTAGRLLLVCWTAVALAATFVAPYSATRQFADAAFAPPMAPHMFADGGLHAPYFQPVRVIDPLERRFARDDRRVAFCWITCGHLFVSADPAAPFFLLGADDLGRDVFSRVILSARVSLGIACASVAGSLLVGLVVGVVAGYRGGVVDAVLMRLADFVVVLPALYVVLAVRGALPLVLPPLVIVCFVVLLFAAVGWPVAARGVRSIVAVERTTAYVQAAEALGARPVRIMVRHLAPAAFGFARVQAVLLLPMFVIGEATLSFAGFGLPDDTPGWGTLLQSAGSIGGLSGAPWLLAPVAALFSVVLATHLAFDQTSHRWEKAGYLVDWLRT
jgi:peptide/nickel transport system permease protein